MLAPPDEPPRLLSLHNPVIKGDIARALKVPASVLSPAFILIGQCWGQHLFRLVSTNGVPVVIILLPFPSVFLFMLLSLPWMLFLVSPVHILSHVCHRELAYTIVGHGEKLSVRLLSPHLRLELQAVRKAGTPRTKKDWNPNFSCLSPWWWEYCSEAKALYHET